MAMSDPKRRKLMLGAAAAVLGLSAAPLQARNVYPDRPLTFICPWPVGGTADTTMRVLADQLAEHFRQPVHFRNVAGAAGMMGTRAIAGAKPDGYTIGQIPISVARLSQLGMLSFDPLKDLSFLARASGQTFGIVVRADAPWNSLRELMEAARARPGRLTYGSAGLASATHVGMEELLMIANARMQHLPYKGGAPALADLLGGRIDVLADSSSWAQDVRQGRLRLLATWGEQRPPAFAQAPTLKEAGYDMVVDAPNGIGAPAGLPPAVEAVLRRGLRAAIQSEAFRQACEHIDAPVMYQDADAYRRYVLAQYEKEKRLIEKLSLREQIEKQSG